MPNELAKKDTEDKIFFALQDVLEKYFIFCVFFG
jgi:hypothetical protein